MWKTVLVCGVVSSVVAVCVADEFIQNGTWTTYSVKPCDNPEQYSIGIDMTKRKINRTHDGFNFTIDLPHELTTEEYSLHTEVYKKCDGGYKFQQNYDDTSFCNIMNQYGKDNMERALAMGNIDPPNCPIPKGVIEVKDFVIDYREFPAEALVGDFEIIMNIMKGHQKLSCVKAYVGFIPADD